MLIRKLLSQAQIFPKNLRYNDDTDEVEITWDGGASWTPSPENDPRHADAQRAPALSGDTAQCDAAAGMVQKTRDWVDALGEALNIGAIATGILGVLLGFIPGVGVLVSILIEIATALEALGAAAISGAMTDEVYDQLLCILLLNIDADGQMSATQLQAVRDQVNAEIEEVAAVILNLMWDGTGEVGLSNAGALAGETGDCSACEAAWCIWNDCTADDDSWTVEWGGHRTTAGWVYDDMTAGYKYRDLEIQLVLEAEAHVTEIGIEFNYTKGTFINNNFNAWAIWAGIGTGWEFERLVLSGGVSDGDNQTLFLNLDDNIDHIYIELVSSTDNSVWDGDLALLNVTINGTGDKPTITDWNDCV